jgi:predicted nucleotidyltransferase
MLISSHCECRSIVLKWDKNTWPRVRQVVHKSAQMQTDEQEKVKEKNKMNLGDLVQEKRDQILQIAARHGAYNVRVFGSAAKGTAGPDSDLDILVDVGPSHSAWFPAGLILDLEALLEREVDVVTEDALHWYIRDRVLAEAVPL